MNLLEVWHSAQEELKNKIGSTSYDTWFSTIHVRQKDEDTLVIETPDEFFMGWIVEHYQKTLEEIASGLSARKVLFEFLVNPNILKEETHSKLSSLEKTFSGDVSCLSQLNNRFTFENFVVGPSNRFACAACLAVAESPAKAYNPLFIYGPVGLGKTHLIQSITHKIHKLHPRLKVRYMSSEIFTNELIDAIRHRATTQFRKKYREIDVLLIDDVHFIAGKESTQEEFFHTFNYLHNNRKQIIITSDRPPKEISNLEERLRSRFAWGLITDIQPPDFETRVAILRKKVENESLDIPDDVIYFIAEQIHSNIRELEGALIRVSAYSLLEEKKSSLDMAQTILKDMVKENASIINVDMVLKAVSDFFQITLNDLKSKKRNKNIVLPRQVAMYLSRQLTGMSLPEIGYAFGGKDHTTVLHSCKKIEKQVKEDTKIKTIISNLSTSLKK